ncbi:hypothetical protein BDN71DRAFT_1458484 [Pleurotus eryngii]|uniref:Uncharacterized protein n=1 Tax=Pleurotus eryngii TaxID=5323 RepID=A0A9P5ZHE7_PLEER|nr:hypothetical protein BDN71DRAFT_1458484 [Pleurotus eryngii]
MRSLHGRDCQNPAPFRVSRTGPPWKFYWTHHPLLREISASSKRIVSPRSFAPVVALPSTDALPSTGDVFSTLAASTFEEGAILCVNMGDGADIVGTVYGG